MNFNFRPIVFKDWEILLKWRNDPVVRMNSHNSELIEEEMHKTYIRGLLKAKDRKQYIFSVDDKEVGTIREDELGHANELSYIISPDEYGKKLGELMIRLFLHDKEGRFHCEIKKDNIASIKAAERSGFTASDTKGEMLHYSLDKKMRPPKEKLLLVGPSSKIEGYGADYFEEKKKDGFKILAYSGAVHHFKDIGFKPDYFSFIDPNTISHKVDFFENDPFLNNTNLLMADLYKDGFKDFFRLGFTCHTLIQKGDLFEKVKTLKFLENFKNVFACEMKRVKGSTSGHASDTFNIYTIHNQPFSKEFLFISGRKGENMDKFTCFLMPLVFYFFKDLKEIKTLGFGEFSQPRYKEHELSNRSDLKMLGKETNISLRLGYDEFMDTAERNLPLIKSHLKERDIKFSSETDNFFSERLR